MVENDFLFDLVQSLDENELRFIVNFANGKRKKPDKLLALLDDIRDGKNITPKLLKEKYRSYGVTKFKLKQLILHSLRLRNTEENAEQRINVHLENEGILYRKGIHYQAMKELRQARKVAEQHQKLDRLLQVLLLTQHRLIESKTKELEAEVKENIMAIRLVLAQLNQQVAVTLHYQDLFAAYRTQDQPPLDDSTAPDFPGDFPDQFDTPFDTQIYTFMAESLVARSQRNYTAARQAIRRALDLYESPANSHFLEDQFTRYKILLANCATYMAATGDFDALREIIHKFRSFEDEDFNSRAETFQNRVQLELLWMNNVHDFSRLTDLKAEIEAGLIEFNGKVNAARQLSLWYNLMVAYFIKEDFRGALDLIHRIIDHKRLQVRKEIHYTIRLIEVVIFYELRIEDMLDNIIIALERYLQRNDQLTPFKLAVIRSIHKITKTPLNDRTRILYELEIALVDIKNSNEPQDFLGLNIILAWAKSRASGLTILEIFNKRTQENSNKEMSKGSFDINNV